MKKLTPINAKTFDQICDLKTDHIDSKHHWLLLDEGSVTIAEQTNGKPAKAMIDIPRRTFDRFIRWYLTGSKR